MLSVHARRLAVLLATLTALVLTGCAGVTTTSGPTGVGVQNRVWAFTPAAQLLAPPTTSQSSCSRPGFTASTVGMASGFCVAAEDTEGAFDLFHGTDTESAGNIVANGIDRGAASELGGGDEFWTTTSKGDAELFAKVNPAGGEPAVVGIRVTGGVEKAVANGILEPAEGLPGAYTVRNWGAFNRIATYGPAG
jgi:hypothetical protein